MDAELSSSEPNSEQGAAKIDAKKIDANGPANPQASVKCPHCGTLMAANSAFCPGCAWSMTPLSAAERAAAAIVYLPFVASAVILFLPEFRKNRFVRFHAWQSLLLWGVFLVLTVLALLLSNIAAAIVFLLVGILAALAMLFLWIVLSLKAWEGERFGLPLFGELATRLSR